jgi:5-methylcytosine-specific restriction endonuclease McrA
MAVRKPKRGEKCRASNTWTEARYFQFIRTALRSAFARYPVRFHAKKQAERTVTGKRHRYEYKCAGCKKWFKSNEVQVDHIEPCGSLRTYKDLPKFVERLFCEADGLQILCKSCHHTKTQAERAAAKKEK